MADEEDAPRPAEGSTNPIKTLERLLRHAQLLNGTLTNFQRELQASNPLPPWALLQTRTNAMREGINDLVVDMDKHRDLLSSTVLLPTQHFPTKHHANILDTLFRTKMEPNVEDWEEQVIKAAHEKEARQEREKRDGNSTMLSEKDRHTFWQWAPEVAQAELMKHPWFSADFTLAEKEAGVENVVHGLKRDLVEPDLPADSDEEEYEDDEEDDFDDADQMDLDIAKPKEQQEIAARVEAPSLPSATRPVVPTDKILRFMTKGDLPR